MARLFISHATGDRKFVEDELVGLLRALGFDPWFAETDIQTSEQWERCILGALKSSKWFVLVMSPRSATSERVKDEIAWAVDEAPDRIVPIMIEHCNPRDFHIKSTLKFGDPDRHVIALFDSVNSQQFVPRRDRHGVSENDYGIVFSCKNPFSASKRIVLAAGSFGYGTWACVRFLLSNDFLAHPLTMQITDAEFLIETDILWEAPQHIKLHVARTLTNGA